MSTRGPVVLAGALLIAYVIQLLLAAGGARFFSDECYHAFRSAALAHGDYPVRVPELYGGRPFETPPLLHVIGAGFVLAFGPGSLAFVNIWLLALLGVGMLVAGQRVVGPFASAGALLVWLASPLVATYGLLYYQEMLTAVAFAALLVALRATWRETGWKRAVTAGLAAGALLLAKQSGFVVLGVLAVVAAVHAVRFERKRGRRVLAACAVGILVWLPFGVRNMLAFGNPFSPRVGGVVDERFLALQRETWTQGFAELLKGIGSADSGFGLLASVVAAAGIVALGVRCWRSAERPWHGLVLFVIVGSATIFLFADWAQPRHFLLFLAVLALYGMAGIFAALESLRVGFLRYAALVLLAWPVVTTLPGLPQVRQAVNVPPELLDAYTSIRALDIPHDAPILSLWTYSTMYYTGHPATWPEGDAPQSPVALYFETDCGRFRERFREAGLEYVLVDHDPIRNRIAAERFQTVNYPERFLRCLGAMQAEGAVETLYEGPRMTVARLRDGTTLERWIAFYRVRSQ